MRNRNFTIKATLAAMACTACVNLSAQQKEYPQPEKMTPGMSEYWTPQPKIVTPGDIKTNSAPSDAIVLFDGKDLSAWESTNGQPAQWTVHDGVFTVNKKTGDIQTKQKFNNYQLHIEWCVPENITGTSRDAATAASSCKECTKFRYSTATTNETYVNGQTGSIYKQTPPLANAMRKPGEWNVYDIIYTAPIFKEDGTYRVPPSITVIQNGIVLQNNTTILGTTEYIGFPKVVPHGAGPIILQSHGDPSEPISFRNIWLREL